ncbi:hypothetical protein [Fluviicola sp.]|uniref:hypothetical protein n=1 Tax=Fluviicola sp. TaxID=1917219 RepID=UPI0031D935D8
MKNKRFTYVLLVVVGFIYFKLFVRISSNITEEGNVPVAQVDEMKLENIQPKKNFHLKANYADPFLKTGRIAVKPAATAGNENLAPPEPPKKKEKPPVYWPAIKYYGLVQKTTSKKPRALISIDGTMYKIYPNEEIFDGIVIKSITRENMVITFQKETKTISLNP